MIFNLLGTPSKEDVSFLADEKYLNYLAKFPSRPPTDLREKFPASAPEGLDILSKMLNFNPNERQTVDELLSHPYFNDIVKNGQTIPPPQKVDLPFEKKAFVTFNEIR